MPYNNLVQCTNIIRGIIENKFVNPLLSQVQKGANTLAKDDEGRTALHLVRNILEEDTEDANSDNRRQMRDYLEEVSKNPLPLQLPPKPRQQTKLDTGDVFTSGVSEASRSCEHQTDKPTLTSLWRGMSSSLNKENREVQDSTVERLCKPIKQRSSDPTRNKTSKLGKHRLSEPSRPRTSDSRSRTDSWQESMSPVKRKHSDVDVHRSSNEMKRLKQASLQKKTSIVAPMATILSSVKPRPSVMQPPPPSLPPASAPVVTTRILSQPVVPEYAPLKLRVKIKIRNTLFLMPVKAGQTITDLAGEAAQRYRAKLGILPKLSLKTSDGAELAGEDVAAELLMDGDALVGEVDEDEHVGLLQKYQETCTRLGVEDVLKDVIDGSGTSICLTKSQASHQQLECLFTTILSCVTLATLDISFNRLSKEVSTTFCSVLPTLTSLNTLNISGCGVSNANFLKVSESLSKLPLESLHLDFNGISHCLCALIELAVSLPKLDSLSAKCCTLTSTQLSPDLSQRFRDSSLSFLDLSQNHMTNHPVFPKRLKSLSIGGSSIEDSNISFPATLEHLCLENCSLNDTNFKALLSNLPNIRTFKCPLNHITGDSVLDLIRMFPNLSALDLSSNPLGPSGIETLTLAPPPNVVLQNCKGAGITAETITALHAVVQCCDLSFNKINYQGFCNILSQEVRDGVVCLGNKLIINGVGR